MLRESILTRDALSPAGVAGETLSAAQASLVRWWLSGKNVIKSPCPSSPSFCILPFFWLNTANSHLKKIHEEQKELTLNSAIFPLSSLGIDSALRDHLVEVSLFHVRKWGQKP